jgi:hypothetical protein
MSSAFKLNAQKLNKRAKIGKNDDKEFEVNQPDQCDLFLLDLAIKSTTCWFCKIEGFNSTNFFSNLGALFKAVSNCNKASFGLPRANNIKLL